MSTAANISGTISVRTTEQGLPLALSVEPSELRRDPSELANQIMRLCRQAANRAGLARREELQAAGLSSEMLALTGLPKPEDVAAQEWVAEEEYDEEPQSWLREA
ncbi:hypothetical protein AB0C65_13405 [Nocardia sp. NPDC048505]|uniref:hypothetical protein n=1 Tax=Nocardia sp. NPDC048505 TaxID=3155756 RepID=UPI0033DBF8C5